MLVISSCHLTLVHQIKMESTLENGCLCSMLCHTPTEQRQRAGKVSHVWKKRSNPGAQLMILQHELSNDKISQKTSWPFISKATQDRKELVNKKDNKQ